MRVFGRRRGRPLGLTLAEVSMSLGIGVGVVAATGYTYTAGKMNAGDAKARTNIAQIKAIVEQLQAAKGGQVPSYSEVPRLYARSRPTDFDKSPWGGSPSWWSPGDPWYNIYPVAAGYGGSYNPESWGLYGNMIYFYAGSSNSWIYVYDRSRDGWFYYRDWAVCYLNWNGKSAFCDGGLWN